MSYQPKPYERETMDAIRARCPWTKGMPDHELARLYRAFCQQEYCAGWLEVCPHDAFTAWATVPPIHRISDF